MKKFKRMLSLVMGVLFLVGAFCFPTNAASADAEYKEKLISLGFPSDYAEKLTELHALHPEWNFTPLMVTELNSKYTWDYVLYMETDDEPNRSLVPTANAYSAYHHEKNETLYDAGYYQASKEAVAYFMDPRNFLNEKDIFQFENLAYNSSVTLAQVNSALAGTFMENAKLENGKTYAEYFIEVGRELDISPIHLASRARQEQGNKGTSSQISGKAGDKLWYYYDKKIQVEDGKMVNVPSSDYTYESLIKYNGLYNIYNINATGSGRFPILLNGMTAAEAGTPEMASKWGGSPSWNTKWKAIYGGAYKLAGSYIGNYQNTLYLQKWNVDNRSLSKTGISKNFWGQYMQNIDAALLEARTTFNSFAENQCIDCAYNFLIPVYADMPASPSPDPANGKFRYYAPSDTKFSYASSLTTPVMRSATAEYITVNCSVDQGDKIELSGHSAHSYGIIAFEYSIDGGEWKSLNSSYNQSAAALYTDISSPDFAKKVNSFSDTISTSDLSAGNHTVAVRARANYNKDASNIDVVYYLVAMIDLEIKGANRHTVTLNTPDGTTSSKLKSGEVYTLPTLTGDSSKNFAGWKVKSESATMLLPSGAALTVLGDITVSPVYLELELLRGAAVKLDLNNTTLRFTMAADAKALIAVTDIVGAKNVNYGMIFCESSYAESFPPAVLFKIGHGYTREASLSSDSTATTLYYDCDTNVISASDYKTSYSASGYIDITYTNNETIRLFTDFSFGDNSRSVKQVATAALADTGISYGSANRNLLEEMAK